MSEEDGVPGLLHGCREKVRGRTRKNMTCCHCVHLLRAVSKEEEEGD